MTFRILYMRLICMQINSSFTSKQIKHCKYMHVLYFVPDYWLCHFLKLFNETTPNCWEILDKAKLYWAPDKILNKSQQFFKAIINELGYKKFMDIAKKIWVPLRWKTSNFYTFYCELIYNFLIPIVTGIIYFHINW